MARAGPRKIREYSLEFKLTAVQLSEQPGIQVQAVAAALDIHPFMPSASPRRQSVCRAAALSRRSPYFPDKRTRSEALTPRAPAEDHRARMRCPSVRLHRDRSQ
jgi:transposase